ncbi:methionine--tRNA ligase [candidate division WWE3 bacterium CG08_land_8_20_14_0_20_40_13]|uniref:Methionine--tRNA ligase n=1 Tax=candidate division WWE3 bacterium CG08_land_8_20_14_0_20_40_13 TaxID=1975084 RepID=A0A2H0XD35_UNCKA|nr:MAG: methionine--tRNA ligase [candidate division WWE3 bacterium CG08_land_8_20_14_0_20_40_13]
MVELVKIMNFYLTTPIYYSNDAPHLGHLSTTIFADIIVRYHRLIGDNTLFLTGVDEHGEKIALTAEKAGKDPQTFVDEMAIRWQKYWKSLNVQNDIFMRTSDPRHKKIAQELLVKIKEKGDIYQGVYKGMYCTGCEEFKSERELVNGTCPEHRPDQISYREETNYFFKLSKYTPLVKKMLEDGQIDLIPAGKKKEILSRLNDDITDLSVSREKVSWGITLPWDKSQTIYVWVEALMNYYSATKIYDKESFWPASVHFLGKGNNWFHSVIWPALLLSCELPLPKRIFVHGYYNVEGVKMSKSLGNVISPDDLVGKFGVDGTRYLMCASEPYFEDFSVSKKWFDEVYNNDLANGLGNLVSRVSKMASELNISHKSDNDFNAVLEKYLDIKKGFEEYNLLSVVEKVRELITATNEKLNKDEPWKLKGKEKEKSLKQAIDKILEISLILTPVMPATAKNIMDAFCREKITATKPLFVRLVS